MLLHAITGLLLLAAYLHTGHLKWVQLLAADNNPDCLITRGSRDGSLPGWVYHFYIATWVVWSLIAFAARRLKALHLS